MKPSFTSYSSFSSSDELESESEEPDFSASLSMNDEPLLDPFLAFAGEVVDAFGSALDPLELDESLSEPEPDTTHRAAITWWTRHVQDGMHHVQIMELHLTP